MIRVLLVAMVAVAVPEEAQAAQITGEVVTREGKPVAGAVVIVAKRAQGVKFIDGRLPSDAAVPKATTDRRGRFSLAEPDAPFSLVIVADTGLAVLSNAKSTANSIVLEPWGRIHGTVRVGSRPDAGRRVLTLSAEATAPEGPRLTWRAEAQADARGNFDLPRVAPGEVFLSRSAPGFGPVGTDIQFLDVAPGSQISTTIGGIGCRVVGRVDFTADATERPHFTDGTATLARIKPPLPYPEGFHTWNSEKRQAWLASFARTKEGRAFIRSQGRYRSTIATDGSFRIEDVPPGRYQLIVSLTNGTEGATREVAGGSSRCMSVKSQAAEPTSP